MDESTRAALEGSIAKWFYNGPKRCGGCPVMERIGMPLCVGSPYERWVDLGGGGRGIGRSRRLKAAAEAELAFLRELLPVPA